MYFSVISARARGREHNCAISFIQTVHSTHGFHSVNESVLDRIEWASDSGRSDGLTCFVSIESAVLN